MEKEFIPYEQALALKELGFDEPCFGSYIYHRRYKEWFLVQTQQTKNASIIFEGDISVDGICIASPLYQQAFRWLREKYGLVHTVYSNASGYIWELHYNQERGGTHICDSGESGDCEMSGVFIAYEKAELECLKKLIEIVKTNETHTNNNPSRGV